MRIARRLLAGFVLLLLSSGQSGLPWSGHYRDWVDAWSRVEYLPLWPAAGAAPVATLRLVPGG
jgi:acyl-homoserine lactone acylase PvdQ